MNKIVDIIELRQEMAPVVTKMITGLMNYHRKLNNAPKEYWQTDEQSAEDLQEWLKEGQVFEITAEGSTVGFFYITSCGQSCARLEDLYIEEGYRSMGIGRKALEKLDELMQKQGKTSIFVEIIPRNPEALSFYRECGFDHLNIIQLRKNYDKRLNKDEEIEVLGFRLKKY